MDSLFGGSLSSRLFQEVREKRGLVYSIYSFSSLFWETGLTGLYFGCRPEKLEAVVETVNRELCRLVSEPVPDGVRGRPRGGGFMPPVHAELDRRALAQRLDAG